MQPVWIIRIFFVLFLTLCGYGVGAAEGKGIDFSLLGLLLALFIIALEYSTQILSSKRLILSGLGAFFGLSFSFLFRGTFPAGLIDEETSKALFNLLFMYFGIVIMLRNEERISLSRLRLFVTQPKEDAVLLDTSVIIDGRIGELYGQGFMGKDVIVPTFVVDELQTLSDSRDASKRHNGRRGLENLEKLNEVIAYQLLDKDYHDVEGVDHKLIVLAKELGATVCTNDYNLSKVCAIHKVKALNINTLAASLRPNLSVGDQLVIELNREGKDENQAVGYLEDGTMVVVDNSQHLIGKMVPVSIVGMMQTKSGRLAFGRLLDDEEQPSDTLSKDSQSAIEMLQPKEGKERRSG